MTEIPFFGFPKIPRAKNSMVTVTEKIDGTNGLLQITEDGRFLVGSRNRWLAPGKATDNHGFAAWALANREALVSVLGPGRHFGEWWGAGINRRYGLAERRFSLFDTFRWRDVLPTGFCCSLVPVLWHGELADLDVPALLAELKATGSLAAPGWTDPEGLVLYQHATRQRVKYLYDPEPKSKRQVEAA